MGRLGRRSSRVVSTMLEAKAMFTKNSRPYILEASRRSQHMHTVKASRTNNGYVGQAELHESNYTGR
jgi:hypothetical protein